MQEFPRRLALALLLLTGLSLLLASSPGDSVALQHRAVLLALMGAALSLSPWVAPLRMPALAVSLLSQLAWLAVQGWQLGASWPVAELLQVLALLTAGAILVREARREARWDAPRPLRQEA